LDGDRLQICSPVNLKPSALRNCRQLQKHCPMALIKDCPLTQTDGVGAQHTTFLASISPMQNGKTSERYSQSMLTFVACVCVRKNNGSITRVASLEQGDQLGYAKPNVVAADKPCRKELRLHISQYRSTIDCIHPYMYDCTLGRPWRAPSPSQGSVEVCLQDRP